jgi:hypothetical protein
MAIPGFIIPDVIPDRMRSSVVSCPSELVFSDKTLDPHPGLNGSSRCNLFYFFRIAQFYEGAERYRAYCLKYRDYGLRP